MTNAAAGPATAATRKLIVRAFNISLDGMTAEYGTEYFEWCMSGIDPRVPELASHLHLPADESQLDPTGELYQRAYALIMGRAARRHAQS